MKHPILISFFLSFLIHVLVLFPYGNFSTMDFKAKRKDLVEIELLVKKKKPPPKKKIKKKKPKPKPKKVIEPPKEEPEEPIEAEELKQENKEPTYPKIAIRNNWEGVVIIKVEILENGHVGSLLILKSSGYKLLDRSALKALKTWRFRPATTRGKPIKSFLKIPVKFELR